MSDPPSAQRSPIGQLLDMFALEEEQKAGGNSVLVNATPAPAGDAPAGGAGAQGAGNHASAAAIPFANWHIGDQSFPDEFKVPLRIPMADAIASTVPKPEPAEDVKDSSFSIIYDAASTVAHADAVMKAVNERVANIKKARALMPVIPQGKAAGTLQASGGYTTIIAGKQVQGTGWMFQEPPGGEYLKWFNEQLKKRYDDAIAEQKALAAEGKAGEAKRAWARACQVAAVIALGDQEGTPSSINTYDGRVLTWGMGLAATGTLQRIMHFLAQDPKVRKAFYCCGFKYDCEIIAEKGYPVPQYHGIYQIVDLTRDPPGVVYGDNHYHDTVPRNHKKGDFEYNNFMALKALTAQPELIYMLIQLARDPETRDACFKQDVDYAMGAVDVAHFDQIETQALYVFIAQVQHNWGIKGRDPVKQAIATMDAAERALPKPSVELDRAIAKGVVRMLMKVLQEQRFQNAVRYLKSGKYPKGIELETALKDIPAATEFGLRRLIDNYWTTLQNGKKTQDSSKLQVSDFLVPTTGTPSATNYVWDLKGTRYDFGSWTQMNMRFPHDDFTVRELSADRKKVTVRDERTKEIREEDVKSR